MRIQPIMIFSPVANFGHHPLLLWWFIKGLLALKDKTCLIAFSFKEKCYVCRETYLSFACQETNLQHYGKCRHSACKPFSIKKNVMLTFFVL